ncbi:MAG: phosphate ABC transporter permease PstA [Thermoplasmatota archaeon]
MSRLFRRKFANGFALVVCLLLALAAALPLASILWQVWERGHAALNWGFLTQPPRQDPHTFQRTGGIAHALVGSAIVVGLASLMGAPVGVLTGTYLAETGRGRAPGWVRTVTDALAGTPSIVAGLFGYALVAARFGFSAWAAACALALLMVPTVARTTEEALRTVPQSYRDGALALGAPHWKTLLRVVAPAAWPGTATGLILAVARIAGETAPLIVTMIGALHMVTQPGQSMETLPVLIYDYGRAAQPALKAQGWGAALVLIALILVLNLVVRAVSRRRIP